MKLSGYCVISPRTAAGASVLLSKHDVKRANAECGNSFSHFHAFEEKNGGRRLTERHGETLVGFNGAGAGAPGAVGGASSPADSQIET